MALWQDGSLSARFLRFFRRPRQSPARQAIRNTGSRRRREQIAAAALDRQVQLPFI
jgi:hypothetical protein